MKELHPAMHMNMAEGSRRLHIEDVLDDVAIAEIEAEGAGQDIQETTLQRVCRELGIEYTDEMRTREAELARLAELGQMGTRIAELTDIIERYGKSQTRFL